MSLRLSLLLWLLAAPSLATGAGDVNEKLTGVLAKLEEVQNKLDEKPSLTEQMGQAKGAITSAAKGLYSSVKTLMDGGNNGGQVAADTLKLVGPLVTFIPVVGVVLGPVVTLVGSILGALLGGDPSGPPPLTLNDIKGAVFDELELMENANLHTILQDIYLNLQNSIMTAANQSLRIDTAPFKEYPSLLTHFQQVVASSVFDFNGGGVMQLFRKYIYDDQNLLFISDWFIGGTETKQNYLLLQKTTFLSNCQGTCAPSGFGKSWHSQCQKDVQSSSSTFAGLAKGLRAWNAAANLIFAYQAMVMQIYSQLSWSITDESAEALWYRKFNDMLEPLAQRSSTINAVLNETIATCQPTFDSLDAQKTGFCDVSCLKTYLQSGKRTVDANSACHCEYKEFLVNGLNQFGCRSDGCDESNGFHEIISTKGGDTCTNQLYAIEAQYAYENKSSILNLRTADAFTHCKGTCMFGVKNICGRNEACVSPACAFYVRGGAPGGTNSWKQGLIPIKAPASSSSEMDLRNADGATTCSTFCAFSSLAGQQLPGAWQGACCTNAWDAFGNRLSCNEQSDGSTFCRCQRDDAQQYRTTTPRNGEYQCSNVVV